MRAPDNRLTKYFRLGDVGVQINFPDISFADQACRHIFLCNGFRGRTIAVIDYIFDESVDRILSSSGQPNVVGIAREPSEHGGQRVVLRMFDQFTVILDIEAKKHPHTISLIRTGSTPAGRCFSSCNAAHFGCAAWFYSPWVMHGSRWAGYRPDGKLGSRQVDHRF